MPNLPVLILRHADVFSAGGGPSGVTTVVPRPRIGGDERRSTPVIRRGQDALVLLDVAPPSSGLKPGSVLLGFALGAMVATRRRTR
ncbi:MAG TPA: hypothetical protein VLR26_17515 [Frankiaceae bacterium]|nr:hypothetical protein [Frankiaceae bacterium]